MQTIQKIFINFTKQKQTFIFYNLFLNQLNDLKNTWKGIEKLMFLKRTSMSVSSAVSITLTKSEEISNVFNNYFVKISSTIQSTIKFSRKKFHAFFLDIDINSFSSNQLIKQRLKILFCLSVM